MSFSLLETEPWILEEDVSIPLLRFHLMSPLPVRYHGPVLHWEALTSELTWVGALPAEVVQGLELTGSARGTLDFDYARELEVQVSDAPQHFSFGAKIRPSSSGHPPLIVPLKATVTSDKTLRLWEGQPLSLLRLLEGKEFFNEDQPCHIVAQSALQERVHTYTLADLNLQIVSSLIS